MKFRIFLILVSTTIINGCSGDEIPEGFLGYKYPDSERYDYSLKVLEALGRPYRVIEREGTWVYWLPETAEQEKEFHNRVSQYFFVREVCPSLELPQPHEPAKEELSCSSTDF